MLVVGSLGDDILILYRTRGDSILQYSIVTVCFSGDISDLCRAALQQCILNSVTPFINLTIVWVSGPHADIVVHVRPKYMLKIEPVTCFRFVLAFVATIIHPRPIPYTLHLAMSHIMELYPRSAIPPTQLSTRAVFEDFAVHAVICVVVFIVASAAFLVGIAMHRVPVGGIDTFAGNITYPL